MHKRRHRRTTLGHMLQLGAKPVTRPPVTYSARCHAWVPISLHTAALAACLGSLRQTALLPPLSSDTLRKPALRVLDEDTAYAADIAALDALLGLLDGGITAVYVRKGPAKRRLVNLCREVSAPRPATGSVGLSITTLKPSSRARMAGPKWKRLGVTMVTKSIRSSSGRAASLVEHLLPGGIDSVIGHIVRTARADRYFGIYTEASAYELDLILHKSGTTVYGTDEGIASASDHAHSQFSVFHFGDR